MAYVLTGLAVLGFAWLTVLVHESGHLLAGRLFGVPSSRIRIVLGNPSHVALREGDRWISPEDPDYVQAFRSHREESWGELGLRCCRSRPGDMRRSVSHRGADVDGASRAGDGMGLDDGRARYGLPGDGSSRHGTRSTPGGRPQRDVADQSGSHSAVPDHSHHGEGRIRCPSVSGLEEPLTDMANLAIRGIP